MNKLKNHLYDLLKADTRLWNDKKAELNETLLKDLIDKLDGKLLEILLSSEDIKEKFFIKAKNVYILKQNELKFFIDENKLDNSYTQYRNKIGLRVGNKLLSERDEVVLDWPFKDCVLEGGMTKEDQKRNEIFFNEVLAKDEIDRLYEPKALVNWKRYTAKGEEKVAEIKRDKDGTIKENLIIKGNNLLALHTLKKEFAGKVKLIYIDPPYNTGNDGFKYNDNFNHSTWLTFMKNRLEIARELLRDDGVIFVQCDDNEQAYLKVLMDEIFGRENFVNNIIPIMNPRGRQEASYPIAKAHEYLVVYSKTEGMATFFNINKKIYSKNENVYRLLSLRKSGNASSRRDRPNMYYPVYFNAKSNEISIEKKEDYKIEILPVKTSDGTDGRWRWRKENVEANKHLLVVKKNTKGFYDIYEKNFIVLDGEGKGEKIQTYIKDKNIINDKANEHLRILFGNKIFDYPKSEYLIKKIIDFSTQPNDIVLDYHLGSGTTCAVAHKMGRQYIGIEQMDYIETVAVKRLQKVIEGEQGGISKSVNWKGGGDFIYLELAKWNEEAKEKILNAKNLDELTKLFDELYERYFLNYNVKTKEFKEKIVKEEDFNKLSLDEQKKLFVEMLDMNQMYVNFSERNDKKYGLSADDIKISEMFYSK